MAFVVGYLNPPAGRRMGRLKIATHGLDSLPPSRFGGAAHLRFLGFLVPHGYAPLDFRFFMVECSFKCAVSPASISVLCFPAK